MQFGSPAASAKFTVEIRYEILVNIYIPGSNSVDGKMTR